MPTTIGITTPTTVSQITVLLDQTEQRIELFRQEFRARRSEEVTLCQELKCPSHRHESKASFPPTMLPSPNPAAAPTPLESMVCFLLFGPWCVFPPRCQIALLDQMANWAAPNGPCASDTGRMRPWNTDSLSWV